MSLSKSLNPLLDCVGIQIDGDGIVFSPSDRFSVVISPRDVFIQKLGGLALILWHDSKDVVELDPTARRDSELIDDPATDTRVFTGIGAQTMTAMWRKVYWRVTDLPPFVAFLTDPRCVILVVVNWLWMTHLCKFFENSQFPSNMPLMPLNVLRLLAPPTKSGVSHMVKWTRVYIDGEKDMKEMQINLLPAKYEEFDLTQPMINKCAARVDRMLARVERSRSGNFKRLTLPPLLLKEIVRQLDIIRCHAMLPDYDEFDLDAISSIYGPVTESESLQWTDLSNIDDIFDQLDQWTQELNAYEMLEMQESCEADEMPDTQDGETEGTMGQDPYEGVQIDQAAGGDIAHGGKEQTKQGSLPMELD